MKTYRITDIKWDLDGECANVPPTETIVCINVKPNETDSEIENKLSDLLSDKFGYCHCGFNYNEEN